jgi:LacI family transcriptional regulator
MGLSSATVSRVLSGQAERYRISSGTRDRILANARSSGLVVDHLARSLRLRRTLTIGFVAPDISDSFFAALARHVERSARRHGYSLLVADTADDPVAETQALTLMLDRHVDGLILAPVGTPASHLPLARLAQRPCVLVDRLSPELAVPAITADHRRGAELAVQHLIERGHRRIACIQGRPGSYPSDERVAGWRAALRRGGLACGADLLFGAGDSAEAGRAAASALLAREPRPTAALVLGDRLSIGVLQALQQAGLTIPADLSLVAVEDQPWTGVVSPPLTTISQPVAELGSQVIELLLERIAGQRSMRLPRTLPVHLIERASVRELSGDPGSGPARACGAEP